MCTVHCVHVQTWSNMQLIKKTIYLREADLELWKACPNKSLLVHNALQGNTVTIPRIEAAPPAYKKPTTKVPNPFDETRGSPNTSETTVSAERFKQGFCKIHGLPLDSRGRCLQKGCKYS